MEILLIIVGSLFLGIAILLLLSTLVLAVLETFIQVGLMTLAIHSQSLSPSRTLTRKSSKIYKDSSTTMTGFGDEVEMSREFYSQQNRNSEIGKSTKKANLREWEIKKKE